MCFLPEIKKLKSSKWSAKVYIRDNIFKRSVNEFTNEFKFY